MDQEDTDIEFTTNDMAGPSTSSATHDFAVPSTSSAPSTQQNEIKLLHDRDIFGDPCKFNGQKLPTLGDVLRRLFFSFHKSIQQRKMHPSLKDFCTEVAEEVDLIWKRTKIPIISLKGIELKIIRFVEEYHRCNRHRNSTVFHTFIGNLDKLFDIACCKCDISTSKCKCRMLTIKIPLSEQKFIIDQRGNRHLNLHEEPQLEAQLGIPEESTFDTIITASEYLPSAVTDSESEAAEDNENADLYTTSVHLPNTSLECERYNVPDRVVAALLSSFAKDMNMKDEHGNALIIDRNKIRREREKVRQKLVRNRKNPSTLHAFAFDGKINKTRKNIMIDGKYHPRIVNEAHIVVVKQPNSVYLSHIVSPEPSTSAAVANKLIEYFNTNNIDLSNLIAISSDGEPKNAGRLDGIIRNFELHLQRPLHWFVCLLHLNELPLKHLHAKLEGFTTGPQTFTGPIAKDMKNCETMPVI